MDPDAAVQRINRALAEQDWSEAREALEDLHTWLRRGGFAPTAKLTHRPSGASGGAKKWWDKVQALIVVPPRRLGGLSGYNQKGYAFYVLTGAGLDETIDSGWEYKEDALDRKKEIPPAILARVVTKRYAAQAGLDPNDDTNWNDGRYGAPRRLGGLSAAFK